MAQEEAISWWAAAVGTDFADKKKVRENVLNCLNELLPDEVSRRCKPLEKNREARRSGCS